VGFEEGVIYKKSYKFAIKIVKVYQYLKSSKRETVLSRQLLRSGTAIGALVREAKFAQSKADFIHKLSIALKEANESDYWIDLLYDTNYLDNKRFKELKGDVIELIKLLVSSVKSLKNKT
jgi:four helix bundle protein